ncbi:DUF885 domain-containing protein [Hyphomonas sp. WL0036]|uniref:DUF885 domain-containing protein n=1 Tax=Hyphomonas sediminis TaxID=2866160 RepID=UPI001C823A42|nr:DUF885 domain-containing protein [Hyphomonas sediminis]MBY9066404.1 DUF885 domain-containing protein [Hyphomonas sediminis]
MIFAVLPVACTPRADPEGTPRRVAREIERTLTTVAQNELTRDPELGTRLGIPPEAAGFPYNRYLTDRSQAAYERTRLSRLETRDLLIRVTRPARGSALARDLDTVITAHEMAETLFMAGHGTSNLTASYPYVADHTRGAYLEVPDLLARYHPLRTPADARDFADRMAQFADAIEDDRRRLEADAQAGAVPPAPVLRRMFELASAAAAAPSDLSPPVVTFENLVAGIDGLDEDERARLIADVRRIAASNVQPAYQAFAESVNKLANTAPELPGVWQLPEGSAYYAAALKAYTGDDASPAGLHERGKREVTALLSETDKALAALGLTSGSVGERLAFLAAQPEQIYPDTEEGRAALIGQLITHADRARAVLSEEFDFAAPEPAGVRAVPPAFAGYLPATTYLPQALDETAPARIEINLTRMADWPDFSLAATAFHELVPGRHLEGSVAHTEGNLPLARQLIWNAAYGEGWAAYAETIADEFGLYSEDPLSRIGYLQSTLLAAARLVVDTGIHSERWTRDQAIAYLTETTGLSTEECADEVDRYTVRPGYAAAYWLGRERILDLRERAIRVLGPRFDAKAFHRIILTGGPRPLRMVEDDVTRWYTAQVEN